MGGKKDFKLKEQSRESIYEQKFQYSKQKIYANLFYYMRLIKYKV